MVASYNVCDKEKRHIKFTAKAVLSIRLSAGCTRVMLYASRSTAYQLNIALVESVVMLPSFFRNAEGRVSIWRALRSILAWNETYDPALRPV